MCRIAVTASLAAGICLTAAATGLAADLPVKAPPLVSAPVYNWTGLYLGAHAGYAWANTDSTAITPTGTFPAGFVFPASPDGFIAGGQIGFNYQIQQWVVGIEGQWSWADLSDTNRSLSPLIAGRYTDSTSEINWIATLTGRLGIAFNNWLLYGKGGFAWAETEGHASTFTGAGALIATSSGSETRTGWTVGVGAEYAFWNNWSAKLEYNYIDLGTDTVTRVTVNTPAFGGAVTNLLRDVEGKIHLVKFGINYRFNFGGPVVARY